MHQLSLIAHRLGFVGLTFAFVVTALAAALGGIVVDRTGRVLAGMAPRLQGLTGAGIAARNVALASELLLIFAVSSFFHKAPEFVYKAF